MAALISYLGDFDRAEEAAQEAFAAAADAWPRDGWPESPRAWLLATARNRAIDRIRREQRLAQKLGSVEIPPAAVPPMTASVVTRDERLELIFMCCHPALSLEAKVALTLRFLGGLSTEDLARAFLVPVPTMNKRITRAKHKIKEAGIPFAIPGGHLLPDRLSAVLAVVYLIFNEGYGGRSELAQEAVFLGRALDELMPDEPEVKGLLALMLLNDARRDARFRDGELILLDEQDRSLWNSGQIAEGRRVLERAIAMRGRGQYALQAAIAASHLDEPKDWGEIVSLYDQLMVVTGSSIVELNRAVAVAEVEGIDAALAILDGLDLDGYRYFHSTRADLLRRAGRVAEAGREYLRALELAHTESERRFLTRRLAECDPQGR